TRNPPRPTLFPYTTLFRSVNQKFNLACTLTDVKNRYSRVKSQLDREAAAGEGSTNRDSPLPMAVANAEMYTKVKNALLGNVEKWMGQQEGRRRTRKIYSQETHHDILDMMN